MYLYVNPINRSYEIANSKQTIVKLNELNTKVKKFANEIEESEEDEIWFIKQMITKNYY